MDVETLKTRVGTFPYWYHRIALPGGVVTPGWAPIDAGRYCVPQDLTGKRVLDIGAWDGYWTWEALKRGAREVVAIDDFSDACGGPIPRRAWETFDLCREAFGFTNASDFKDTWYNDKGQTVTRKETSVYDLYESLYGHFDIVFFFGTIYHLKHPLLALERIAAVCDGALYVETASLDECSPYRGGIGHGFNQNEVVMEFYPQNQYGENPTNWWVPTLECLGAMMRSVGFRDIEAWPLVEKPATVNECRGFASGTKDPAVCPANHPADLPASQPVVTAKVAAVMSVPRLGFQDNMTCAFEALTPLRIPLVNVQGAFWGQCLERGLQQCIDQGVDLILTIDYDTVFTQSDVRDLLALALRHPEAAAVVSVQKGRGTYPVLISLKTPTGQIRSQVPLTDFGVETLPIATGHFGLTVLRASHLLRIPHPWFQDQPNADGQWGPGRMDADIWFWKQLEKAGMISLLACRVPVGHLELIVTWPDDQGQTLYQSTTQWRDQGRPANCWK